MNSLNSYIYDLGFLALLFGGRGLEMHWDKGLIFGGRGLEMNEYDNDDDNNNYYIPDDDDMTNILKLNVLNLFNNLQTIKIYRVQQYAKYYSFSLYKLVLLLVKTKIENVYIYADVNDSWLCYLWRNKSSSLIEAYKNKGYGIEFDGYKTMSIKLL